MTIRLSPTLFLIALLPLACRGSIAEVPKDPPASVDEPTHMSMDPGVDPSMDPPIDPGTDPVVMPPVDPDNPPDTTGACDGNPCQNGGLCRIVGDSFTCRCPYSFTGNTCATPAVSGLALRPSNTSCVAPALPGFNGSLSWTSYSDGTSGLMMLRQLPDNRWLGIARSGGVYAFDTAMAVGASPLLTIPSLTTTVEEGLLGLAIHPQWPTEPYIYLYYARRSGNTRIYIDRYTTSTSGNLTIDPASRVSIFDFERDSNAGNHIGGSIEFDPKAVEPTLYAATGDGENRPAVQQTNTLYGKLLRFKVDTPPYTPEIVAVGLRNPFRWSFDSLTGDLWIGDVGDDSEEEVNFVAAANIPATGGTPLNFGWPIMEGRVCQDGGQSPSNGCGVPEPTVLPLIAPVDAYSHSVGVSVIGGRVYRGTAISGLAGTYFYNDIFVVNGEKSWYLEDNASQSPSNPSDDYTRVAMNDGGFVAYAQGNDGTLYGIVYGGGWVLRLEGTTSTTPVDPVPSTLSQTGCFDANGDAAPGLVPYDLNAALWSDGATKRRWLSLPNDTEATLTSDGDFDFPPGTVLAKEFSVDGVKVETRLFMRHPDGTWAGYTYAWVSTGGALLSDAQLVASASSTRAVPGTTKSWTYPSRSQCKTCHTDAAKGSLGIEALQLNRDHDYGGTTANQLFTLQETGMISGDLAPFSTRALPQYDDTTASVDGRAGAYLHANCSGCHRPGASGMLGRSHMPDMRYQSGGQTLAQRLCGLTPGAGDLGTGSALLVNPGNPGDWANPTAGGSILYFRMSARANVAGSTGAMPFIGTAFVDTVNGLPLVSAFIQALVCP
jgi:uncharacterized repeat protein (TIGR03806 family)